MGKTSNYRVLTAGILASPAAAFLGLFTYRTLTNASLDREADFVFRLSSVTLVMTLPFVITLILFMSDRKGGAAGLPGKVGLTLAFLSLGLTWLPARGLIARAHRNAAPLEARAPAFDTVDLLGKPQRLADQLGKVVVINAWATWCAPCREEMPKLDAMYQKHKNDGLMVFGLSTEDIELQHSFLQERFQVTYPLLTLSGNIPSLYRDVERWPSIFLVDRKGQLRPAPRAGASFDLIEAAVNDLLNESAD